MLEMVDSAVVTIQTEPKFDTSIFVSSILGVSIDTNMRSYV